jgi:ATP-dependent protease ClpP protease subunit
MRYFLGTEKKKRRVNKEIPTNDESEEEEEQPDDPLGILSQLQKFDVYNIDNHIFFRTHITPESIDKLNRIIEQKIREYDLLKGKYRGYVLESEPLILHITSNGGDAFSGFLAIDIIERCKIPIYTVVEGSVCSAASFMSIAGKKRFMTKNSYMLVHQIKSGCNGTYEHLLDDFLNSKDIMEKMILTYVKYSGGKLTKTKLKEILKHDRYWDYSKCIKYGLVDDIF